MEGRRPGLGAGVLARGGGGGGGGQRQTGGRVELAGCSDLGWGHGQVSSDTAPVTHYVRQPRLVLSNTAEAAEIGSDGESRMKHATHRA